MIWLVPAAWLGALALVAPIVTHLVARPRAPVQPFPTLRFLPAGSQASRRRRRIEDWPLLAVRCAIVVTAVAALAGPLVVTAARRAAWNARVIRETVEGPAPSLRGGLARAIAALADAPPGRRLIVVRSTFPLGSITAADVRAVPQSIGLEFERTDAMLSAREMNGAVLSGRDNSPLRLSRRMFVQGARTSVRDGEATPAPPIDFAIPPEAQAAFDAVLAERVPFPAPGRRARLLIAEATSGVSGGLDAAPVRTPWIADAIARIARDADLRAATRQLTATLPTGTFDREPWHIVAEDRDGRPIAAASADRPDRLVVASATQPDQLATAVLMRSMLSAMAPASSFDDAEVVPISDAQLRAWSREPAVAASPSRDTADDDDRRPVWLAVLILLGVETWMRRHAR